MRPNGLRLVITASLALSFGACGLSSVRPSFVVPLAENDFGQFTLLVFDLTGLVQGGEAAGQRQGPANSEAIAHPERAQLDLNWLGGACSHAPTLTLTGDHDDLRVELHTSPPEWQLPFAECPAVGISFGATLSLNKPVAQEAITLEAGE